jgi:uncharacterized protein (TIGR03118 family)
MGRTRAVLNKRKEFVMYTWFRNRLRTPGQTRAVRQPVYHPEIEFLEDRSLPSNGFVETALVSDMPGLAAQTDPALVNPWGFTVSSRGEFLINNNGSGNAALFAPDGTALGAPIVVPPPGSSPAGTTAAPTGQVANTTSDFVVSEGASSAPATYLFATEDGTISGFNSSVDPSQAILGADRSSHSAVYKGLALGSAGGANYLYATNFRSGAVDVFDTKFALHSFSSKQFTDPTAPAGFAPFGIKNINGTLFVTYAKQDTFKHDDVAGPGNGFIDEFDSSGHFLQRFASGTAAGGSLSALNSPWGLTTAPEGFGKFNGALLVGNFGDSHVSAFSLKTGRFLGQLTDTNGQPLVLLGGFQGPSNKGLWGIGFGNGQGGADARTLYFASGINDEADGLFGKVTKADGHGDDGTQAGFDPATATWYLRGSYGPGAPDVTPFAYGSPGWVPLLGDWTGSGTTSIGVFDPHTATFYLKNTNAPGAADIVVHYGMPGWIPVVGDWTGSGATTIGVVDPTTETWYLRNSNTPGAPDIAPFRYGTPGWTPVVGDWTGSGVTTIGVVDPTTETWYLRNSNSAGAPDITPFRYGTPGWTPVVEDWTGSGMATAGVVDPTTETWYLRSSNSAGAPDFGTFRYGAPGWVPLTAPLDEPLS